MTTAKGWLMAVVIAVVLAAICWGGYEGYWALKGHNTNHQLKIDRNNNGAQIGYQRKVDSAIRDSADINAQLQDPKVTTGQRQALEEQRSAIVNQACDVANLLTNPTPNESNWISVNC